MSIFFCLLQASIVVAALFFVTYICVKYPKVFVIGIFVAIILVGLVIAPTVAESKEIVVVRGVITKVAPVFVNHELLLVTVETFNGEIYTYYAEGEIDVVGVIELTIFEDEIINVAFVEEEI